MTKKEWNTVTKQAVVSRNELYGSQRSRCHVTNCMGHKQAAVSRNELYESETFSLKC
jgi:hypothetical protein